MDLRVPSVESASHRHKKEALEKGFGLVLAAIMNYFRLYSKGPSSPVGEEFPGVSSVPWLSVEEFLVAFLMWTV